MESPQIDSARIAQVSRGLGRAEIERREKVFTVTDVAVSYGGNPALEDVTRDVRRRDDIVEPDAIERDIVPRIVDHDHRRLTRPGFERIILPRAARTEDQAIDALRKHQGKRLAFDRHIEIAVREQDGIADLRRLRLNVTHELGEERIGDVGNEQPDDVGAAGAQAARDAVWLVTEAVDRLFDPRLQFGADEAATGQAGGHGGDGNGSVGRHVAHGDHAISTSPWRRQERAPIAS